MIEVSSLTVEKRQEYYLAIEEAIVRGVDYVSFNGQQVKFRTLDEMFRIRNFLRNGLYPESKSAGFGPRKVIVRMR